MPNDWSRHSSYSETKLPKQKRSISMRGERDDTGKWWRCWNCGFPCNVDRDALDTSEHAGTGIVYATYVDNDGVTKYKVSTTSGGCPFCGCKNYK